MGRAVPEVINYLSAAGFQSDDRKFSRLWPTANHLIGKDILITHAVYWPTMLRAIGLPPPRTISAHGWWNVDGAKMSRSTGDMIKPLDLAAKLGSDAFRYFLVRDMAMGRDAVFSEELFRGRYEGILANGLGNLAHRLTSMIVHYCDGVMPEAGTSGGPETELRDQCTRLVDEVLEDVDSLSFDEALRSVESVDPGSESIRRTGSTLDPLFLGYRFGDHLHVPPEDLLLEPIRILPRRDFSKLRSRRHNIDRGSHLQPAVLHLRDARACWGSGHQLGQVLGYRLPFVTIFRLKIMHVSLTSARQL